MATNYRDTVITDYNLSSFRGKIIVGSLYGGYHLNLTGFWKTNDVFRTSE